MSDPAIDRWQPRGKVSVWRHRPSPEWHLAADEPACAAMLELLALMKVSEWPSRRRVPLTHANQTATDAKHRPTRFCEQLTLRFDPRLPDQHWSLRADANEVTLEFAGAGLHELHDALADMGQGGGDYAIGSDDARLWVWWYVA